MAVAIAGVFDVDVILAPVEGRQILQGLDEFNGPGQGATGSRLLQVRQQGWGPSVNQGENMRFSQGLFFDIAA